MIGSVLANVLRVWVHTLLASELQSTLTHQEYELGKLPVEHA